MRSGEQKQNIGFIYKNKCHSVTQTYADAIGAVSYKITGLFDGILKGITLPVYDYYFIESVMSILVPLIKRTIGKKVTIIFRCNDGIFGEKTSAYLYTKNPLKKAVLLFLIKQIDGVIAESEMAKKDAEQWLAKPVEVCESFIENKKLFEDIMPNLKTKSFLFIGEYRPPYDHKNIRFLINLFNTLSEYNLIIIGKNTEALQSIANKNIQILGYVDNILEYYKQATYYIHLPKYETGPITLLEAMASGLIPITNKKAGHYPLVENINKNLILEPDISIEEAAKKIREITAIQYRNKQKISERFKKQMRFHYGKQEIKEKFKKIWEKIK